MSVWQIDDEFFDHATGMHVAVLGRAHSDPKKPRVKHLLQMMTKGMCPTCGHVQQLGTTGDVDWAAEKKRALENLEEIHKSEIDHAKGHGARSQG